jgi:DNA-binding IclR family transcriptional regulator
VRHHLDEGVRLPLERGAAGRVLLAFDGGRGEPYTSIRTAKHYVSLGERDPEIAAASVPVLDAAGHVRGALSVSALLSRFGEEAQARALTALHQSAERLAHHLPRD